MPPDPAPRLRPNSRAWRISQMQPGDSILFERPTTRPLPAFQQTLSIDIGRAGMRGLVSQSLLLGIELSTRQTYEIVRLTRHK